MSNYVDPQVCLDRLTKRFERKIALNEFSIKVESGDSIALLGRNGAGKSTLMRTLTGNSRPTSGSVRVFGMDPVRYGRMVRTRLGIVPQENALNRELTVESNLYSYGSYFGIGKRELRRHVTELLEFFELDSRAGDRVDTLSGGMKRRLTLARGLINAPDLLLLDEPTTGLDPQTRNLIWNRLRELRADGLTIIMATHLLNEAEELCRSVAVMDSGKLLAQGAPTELISEHRPRSTVVLQAQTGYETVLLQAAREIDSGAVLRSGAIRMDANLPESRVRGLTSKSRDMIRSVSVEPPNLEDVYLSLTGSDLRE